MKADQQAFARVVESVADGEPVDWTSVEERFTARERRLARHLRLVESIASVYRTLPTADDGAAKPEAATQQWGTLFLLEPIGQGTSGEVHRAWDSRLHRDVALKLLHDDRRSPEDARERLLEEARRLARLRHEHVVTVYGAEEHDGRVGLWMELVRGESLDARIQAHGPLDADEAARIGEQLCSALAAVHEAGLLHRDVKAQNVIQEPGGRIVLMDFGTGEELRRAQGTNRMVGTPLYLAPEIFAGQAATVQSDIYSLGVLLFYLVTGEFPVTAASMLDLGRAHARGKRRRLVDLRPDLPRWFADVVDRALDPAPARRFRSAAEMGAALREASSGEAESAVGARHPTPWWRQPLTVAAAILLVAVVALIVWTRNAPQAGSAAVQRVAVLPLVDASTPPVSAHLADALTAELIAALGEQTALQVASRSAVLRVQGSTEPADALARILGTDAVVQGTVTVNAADHADSSLRMQVRLISAGNTTLWSRTFQGRMGDALTLQTEVARSIGEALGVAREGRSAGARGRRVSEEAVSAYLLGRYHMNVGGVQRTRQALEAFERATALAPDYAAAYAAAARCYIALGFFGAIPHTAARPQTLAAATRALELDPNVPDALVAMADLKFYYDRNWSAAEADYLQVLALNPSHTLARTQYARFLAALGRLDEAVLHAQDAVDRDTMAPEAAQTLGLIRYYKGEYSAALEALNQSLALDEGNSRASYVIGRVYEALGQTDRAIEATTRAIERVGTAPVSWQLQLIRMHALAGRHEYANQQLAAKLRQFEAQGRYVAPEHRAYVHLAMGERDQALGLLERAVEAYDPGALWFAVDPRLASVRDDPRFVELLRRLGLQQ